TDAGVSHRVQRFGNGATLRIEHRRLQGDEHFGSHVFLSQADTPTADPLKTRSKITSTFLNWSSRSKAFSISAGVRTLVRSGSASSRVLKSFFSWNDRIAFRCTH